MLATLTETVARMKLRKPAKSGKPEQETRFQPTAKIVEETEGDWTTGTSQTNAMAQRLGAVWTTGTTATDSSTPVEEVSDGNVRDPQPKTPPRARKRKEITSLVILTRRRSSRRRRRQPLNYGSTCHFPRQKITKNSSESFSF